MSLAEIYQGGDAMRKSLVFVLFLTICFAAGAQQYSSRNIGKVTTLNKIDLFVIADSSGAIILSTSAHSIYLDHRYAAAFKNTLDAIQAGMKDLESKNITVVDYRVIGKLSHNGWSHESAVDGIMFHLELNSTKDDKVLLLMYSNHDLEDMLFNSTLLAKLQDLVGEGIKSGVDYSDQYVYIQSVIDKIDSTVFQ
jgi:hypothetical protein